jgi:transposase InsO family protein
MGHLGFDNVSKVVSMCEGVRLTSEPAPQVCACCKMSNMVAHPHHPKLPRSERRPLRLVHSDICSMPVASQGGATCFATLLDEDTGLSVVIPVADTRGLAQHLIAALKQLEVASGHKLQAFRSDNGGEYRSHVLKAFCLEEGVDPQRSPPYQPESNGAAERLNRTLLSRVRASLYDAGMPLKWWAEALVTANWLRNRSPVEGQEVTPIEAFYGYKPDLSRVRVFGCLGFAHLPPQLRAHKLSNRAERCWLLGYDASGAYRVLLESGQVAIKRDVVWDESESYFSSWGRDPLGRKKYWGTGPEFAEAQASGERVVIELRPEPQPQSDEVFLPAHSDVFTVQEASGSEGAAASGSDAGPSGDQEAHFAPPPEPTDRPPPTQNERPKRAIRLPTHLADSVRPKSGVPEHLRGAATVADTVDYSDLSDDPTYAQAEKRPDAHLWHQSMQEEINSHFEIGSLEVVDRPSDAKVLPCVWVLKRKRDAQGRIERYKARLCVMGNRQVPGVDFDSVYAPVASATTLRALLAVAARDDLEVDQLDVKTAFLYGELDRDVYMSMPPGYAESGKVFRLRRAVYGLRQAPRAWHDRLSTHLTSLGFKPAASDPSLYVMEAQGERVYLLVYVDDMLVVGKQGWLYQHVKRSIAAEFDVRDLGAVKSFLGYSVERNRQERKITIRQTALANQYVMEHGMESAGPKDVPIAPGTAMEPFQPGENPAPEHYSSLVGSMLYLANCTRPDLSFSVGACSRFCRQPSSANWQVLRGVLKYVASTCDVGITYDGKSAEGLIGYSDSDYAGDKSSRKSVSGYVFNLCGGAISWLSKQQSVVAVSSSEAEYIACDTAAKHALWLRNLLIDLGDPCKAAHICVDNKAAFDMVKAESFSSRTKHIDVQCHHVRDHVARGDVVFMRVSSEENLADVLTKPLSAAGHYFCAEGMGMVGF